MFSPPKEDSVIISRYKLLPTEITDLVDFGTLDFIVEECKKQFGLNEIQKKLLENEIILVLLLFLPSSTFEERIHESLNIDSIKSAIITSYVQENLFELITEILEITDKELALKELSTDNDLILPAIPERETEHVTPLRTMEADAQKIHGYGAYREKHPDTSATANDVPTYTSNQDLSKRAKNIVDIPKYTPPPPEDTSTGTA